MPAKDYYAILGVSPSANLKEIEEAFRRRCTASGKDASSNLEELSKAYQVLRQPNLKRKYDAALGEGRIALSAETEKKDRASPRTKEVQQRPRIRPPDGPAFSTKTQIVLLAAAAVALVLILAFHLWPRYSWKFSEYKPGQSLVHRFKGSAFGEVVSFEQQHLFPNGVVSEAYKIRLSSGEEAWMSKDDINQLTRPQENSD